MAAELPLVSAVVARLEAPAIQLAAYGGIVFPLALVIESPIIMLLAASVALSRDTDAYRKLRRFMHVTSAVLTLLHAIVALSPLYDLIVRHVLHAPPEIWEAGRIGIRIMLPWTWSIAYRRFHQGLLIRFGQSRTVGSGTVVRLAANLSMLALGASLGLKGIVVATLAIASGVLAEAAYIGFRARAVVRGALAREPLSQPLRLGGFLRFYVPLALTSLIQLLWQPLGAAAMGRMPLPLESLAIWPVITGLVFFCQSMGLAYNEVVVALAGQPRAIPPLRRGARILAVMTTVGLLLLAATPLSQLWFGRFAGLPPELSALAVLSVWFALPIPALAVMHSWFQGLLVYSRRTRAIPEALVVFLVTAVGLAWLGVSLGRVPGLFVGLGAMAAGYLTQAAWLLGRSRGVIAELQRAGGDAAVASAPAHGAPAATLSA